MTLPAARSPPAEAVTAQQRRAFARDGYLIVPGVLDQGQCDALVDLVWSLMPANSPRGPSQAAPPDWRGRIQDCCNDIPLYQRKGLVRFKAKDGFSGFAAMSAIYDNPTLLGLFAGMLGRPPATVRVRGLNPNFPFPARVSLNSLLGNRLAEPGGGALLDRLMLPTPPQFPIAGHLETHALELGALVYLSDVEADGGALSVWPGSHRLMRLGFDSPIDFRPNALYKRFMRLLHRFRPRPLAGRAGDVILFHNRLLHANSFNRADQVRHALVIDVLGEDWKARAAGGAVSPADRDRLMATDSLKGDPAVAEVIGPMTRDRLAAWLVRHPGVSEAIQRISKDPVAAGRNRLSAKVRRRRVGDLWIVVSQDAEFHHSFKLDAFGQSSLGRYWLSLDGARLARSDCGIAVEQVEAAPGHHVVRLSGRLAAPHYIRVIRTKSPFADSDILVSDIVPAGARSWSTDFVVPPDEA